MWALNRNPWSATWQMQIIRTGPHGLIVEVWQHALLEIDGVMAVGSTEDCGMSGSRTAARALGGRCFCVSKGLQALETDRSAERFGAGAVSTYAPSLGDFRRAVGPDVSVLQLGHCVHKVSVIFRLLRGQRSEWGKGFCALELDFAAVDDVVHTTLRVPLLARSARSARLSGLSERPGMASCCRATRSGARPM